MAGVPVWQHTHIGGDRPHSHAQGHHHEHSHDGLGEHHAHQHVRLFGVGFTIPVESDDEESQEGLTTFLTANPTVVDWVPSDCRFVELPLISLTVVEVAVITLKLPGATADATFLCDSARHERTGVLLI